MASLVGGYWLNGVDYVLRIDLQLGLRQCEIEICGGECIKITDIYATVVDNRWVDIVEQGFDMGVRLGYALYKDMIAVKISDPVRMAVVASPDYLHGKQPVQAIADLQAHRLIGLRLSNQHGETQWEFKQNGERITFQPEPHFSINNGLLLQAALDGLGIAWLPDMVVREAVAKGDLVELLGDYAMEYEPLYLYYPNRQGHSQAFELVVEALRG